MFGRGSTGGIINQVSKTPSLVPSYGGSATVGTGDFYRGTFDSTSRSAARPRYG